MNPKIVVIVKTILMAALVAGLHALAQAVPDVLPLIPAKYFPLAVLLATAAGLYHKQPPTGSVPGNGPAGAAGLVLLLGFLCGAVSWVYVHGAARPASHPFGGRQPLPRLQFIRRPLPAGTAVA
jgi:apolipoprotein N-acyltransferase